MKILGLLLLAGALWAPLLQAGTVSTIELRSAPVTPERPKDEDRLINELYSHYVGCLEAVGNEEACYRRWWHECNSLFPIPDYCGSLEEKMFPSSAGGDEPC